MIVQFLTTYYAYGNLSLIYNEVAMLLRRCDGPIREEIIVYYA